MSTIEVDPQVMSTAATTLGSTAEQMRAAAHRIGGALHLAGSAGGSAALASSTSVAARRWVAGLGECADVGVALSEATAQARLAYDLVELQARGQFTATVSR